MAEARRRRGVAIAASIAVHAGVLAILALSMPTLQPPAADLTPHVAFALVPLELNPRSAPSASALPRVRTASAEPAPATPAPAISAAPRREPSPTLAPTVPTSAKSPPAAEAAPATPAASGPASPPSELAGQGRDWRVRPEPGDLHGLVHEAIGCGHVQYLKLTLAEQAACDRKFASLRGTETPHIDLIPAEKRAYYDAVSQAYAKVRAKGGVPGRIPVGPPLPGLLADKGGIYIPGVGCSVRFGTPRGWKSYHDRPPHSLKLGALPCFVTPPQALGTEESGVEAPASLRERTDDAAHMKALDAPPKP